MSFQAAPAEASDSASSTAQPQDLEGLARTAAEWAEKLPEMALEYAPRLAAGVVVYLIGRWVSKLLLRMFRKFLKAREIDDTLGTFLHNILRAALLVLVVLSAAQTMGIQTTSFVAVLGAATLAIGLALQGSLSNFASGVMIILFRPFKGGDFVEAAGTKGIVLEVGVFATIVRTPDNKKVIVPNSAITEGVITNYSANDTRRVDMVFGIGYDDDVRKAKEILEAMLKEDDRVLADPEPLVAVGELADSSINLICRPWTATGDYWGVFHDFQEQVKLRFDAAGISIPFPQRDVHLHNAS